MLNFKGEIMAAGILIAALIGLGFVVRLQHAEIKALEQRAELAEARLKTAVAMRDLLRAELESDNEVNAIPDNDLGFVPPVWMLPTTGGR